MAGITRTIIGSALLRLVQTFQVSAGVDSSLNPQLLKVDSAGHLLVSDGGTTNIPTYDTTTLEFYGSTNNVHYVRYRTGGTGGTVVATRTLTYAGGGASDNDTLIGSQLTVP